MNPRMYFRFACTIAALAAALFAGRALWNRYMNSPWTRDGRLHADVIKVAPDVAGIVTRVPVKDNEEVHRGELLFTVDRERYRLALEGARATLAARKAEYEMHRQQAERRAELENVAVSAEMTQDARSQAESAEALYREAQVAVQSAELNLKRTEVRAPVDGFITNLNVHPGDFAAAGEAKLAVLDKNSFTVYAYFEETKLQLLHRGDRVDIHLLGSAPTLGGRVDSLARGIADRDNPTGKELLSEVNPVMNWVRLAQRVPVRIRLDPVPKGVALAAGMTCTVVVRPAAGVRKGLLGL